MAKSKFEKIKRKIEIEKCQKQNMVSKTIVMMRVINSIRIINKLNYIIILLKNKKTKYIIIIEKKYNLIFYLFIFNTFYFLNDIKISYL